jgi:hypothetical protein
MNFHEISSTRIRVSGDDVLQFSGKDPLVFAYKTTEHIPHISHANSLKVLCVTQMPPSEIRTMRYIRLHLNFAYLNALSQRNYNHAQCLCALFVIRG